MLSSLSLRDSIYFITTTATLFAREKGELYDALYMVIHGLSFIFWLLLLGEFYKWHLRDTFLLRGEGGEKILTWFLNNDDGGWINFSNVWCHLILSLGCDEEGCVYIQSNLMGIKVSKSKKKKFCARGMKLKSFRMIWVYLYISNLKKKHCFTFDILLLFINKMLLERTCNKFIFFTLYNQHSDAMFRSFATVERAKLYI